MDRTIKIGGFEWRVKYSADVAYEGNCFGSTHYNSQTIFIDPSTTYQKQEHTLLHEIMHACVMMSGLDARWGKEGVSEEDAIRAISLQLYQVIKDNDLFT